MQGTMNNKKPSAEEISFFLSLAREHSKDLEGRCRRYRRWAVVRRAAGALLLVVVVSLLGRSLSLTLASLPSAKGALTTDKAIDNVQRILMNS